MFTPLKKPFLLAAFCFAVCCCTSCDPVAPPPKEPATPVRQPQPSLQAFTDTLQTLDWHNQASIDQALRLYSELVPNDSTRADSAAARLLAYVKQVVETENAQLDSGTMNLRPLLNPTGPLTPGLKALNTTLHQNHLKPVDNGEGGVYLVPAYETILPTVQQKTSLAVNRYLNLAAKEDTATTLKDAALAIELPELVDRLVESEQLLTQPLPSQFAAEAVRMNRFYTQALIQGADNTPSREYNPLQLTEPFQKGYAYLLSKYPESKAAAKINVWMAVVHSGDRKKVADYLRLLEEQPPKR